jgi:CRISPR/Cas system-associated exonuclease Cas4 (RecB family)
LPSTRALIHAPWSASKVATALRCPRLFYFKYVEKLKEPEVMPEARIGKAVHAAIEKVLQGAPVAEAAALARADLPDDQEQARFDQLGTGIGPFAEKIQQFRRRRRVQRQLVEYSLAVREDMTSTQFYSGDAFYRGILDVAYLYDEESAAVIDHKTGIRYPGARIDDQMESYAVLAALSFRNVRRLWLGIHWVAERAVEWKPAIEPAEINERLVPGLLDNVEAAALAVSDGPRTNPGYQCERCGYRSVCPASREQRYEPVEYYEYEDDDD